MATDALDPGPNGDYPYLPRNPDGTLDIQRRPIGTVINRSPDGTETLINLEPTGPDGRRPSQIAPPPGG